MLIKSSEGINDIGIVEWNMLLYPDYIVNLSHHSSKLNLRFSFDTAAIKTKVYLADSMEIQWQLIIGLNKETNKSNKVKHVLSLLLLLLLHL